MSCPPEISRVNGAKSRGAITKRGKAIASRNSTKHGLLAQQPPILASEDLETFQGIVQGLIDQYNPKTPVEHLLVQQIAMGWQRLHRLWGVEAAIADLEMIRLEKVHRFPMLPPEVFEDRLSYPSAILELMQGALRRLSIALDERIKWQIPKQGTRRWCQSEEAVELVRELHRAIAEAIDDFPFEAVPSAEELERGLHQDCIWMRLIRWKTITEDAYPLSLTSSIEQISETCQEEIEQIEQQLSNLKNLELSEKQAAIASKAIPQDSDRLSRYERHILRGLNDAIDRLGSIQRQRNNEGSMGSFGK
jgi:hypothetical protein